MVRTSTRDRTTDDAPNNCPECGSFTRHSNDPALPATHVNVVCPLSTCFVNLVEEGVRKFDDDEVTTDDEVADAVKSFVESNPQADVDDAITFARNRFDRDVTADTVEVAFDDAR